MEIFVIVLALSFLQVWGSRNPLHKDAWFVAWQNKISTQLPGRSELASFLAVVVPLIIVAILFEVIVRQSIWLALPLAVIVVSYSLGRGEFFEIVREYTQACYIEDWESAKNRASRFEVDLSCVEAEDWPELHRHVFEEASYRGFERMFAVLFWFFILGPVGALMYRLVFLQSHHNYNDALARRWLWILEWPAVRLLGLTFAFTGNFSGCISHWRECFLCVARPSKQLLSVMVLGALSVQDELQPDCEITRKELSLMSKLYQRTLWLWVAAASFMVIFVV